MICNQRNANWLELLFTVIKSAESPKPGAYYGWIRSQLYNMLLLAGTPSTMLHTGGGDGHPCLASDPANYPHIFLWGQLPRGLTRGPTPHHKPLLGYGRSFRLSMSKIKCMISFSQTSWIGLPGKFLHTRRGILKPDTARALHFLVRSASQHSKTGL